MLKNKILEDAKLRPVYVFFDMDGVLAEYDIDKKGERGISGNDYYTNKTPLPTAINFAKFLSETPNITVGILSNCLYNTQAEEKKVWLSKYMPFLRPENINIISYEAYGFGDDKQARKSAKCKFLNSKFKNCSYGVYLIDDDHEILKNFMKDADNIVDVYHISSIYVE